MLAVVKEEELDGVAEDELRGLAAFEDAYFCGPLYLSDDARSLYAYLGDAPIFTAGSLGRALLNPLGTWRELKAMGARMKAKGVEGNMVGDGLTKGGVLCVAPDGELKYTFYEDAGKGIPEECQQQIVAAVRSFGVPTGVVSPTAGATGLASVE